MSRTSGTTSGNISINLGATVSKLQDQRQKARDKCDELVALCTAEDRGFTPEEQKAFDESRGQMKILTDRMKTLTEYGSERDAGDGEGRSRTREDPNGETRGRRRQTIDDEFDDEVEEERKKAEKEKEEKRYARAFIEYIRVGQTRMREANREVLEKRFTQFDEEEQRALSVGTAGAGGYTVPQGFNSKIIAAIKSNSGVLQSRAQLFPTSTGADLPWPTVDDTSQEGEMIAENTDVAEQDLVFSSVTLKSFIFSSKMIRMSQALLQDSAIDIEGVVAKMLGLRIGRILNRKFTLGTGTAEPQGVVPFSTIGVTTAAVAAITYDEMLDLQHSVDPAYRALGGCEWMWHDTTFKLLRKLKDSSGRPLWLPAAMSGAAAGAPALWLDSPYVINQHMATPATAQKTVLYGDFDNYIVRQVKDFTLMRLVERYAEKLQTALIGFGRWDGRGINAGTNPVKHLIHA